MNSPVVSTCRCPASLCPRYKVARSPKEWWLKPAGHALALAECRRPRPLWFVMCGGASSIPSAHQTLLIDVDDLGGARRLDGAKLRRAERVE